MCMNLYQILLLGVEINLHPHVDITSKILEANKGRFHILVHICSSQCALCVF